MPRRLLTEYKKEKITFRVGKTAAKKEGRVIDRKEE